MKRTIVILTLLLCAPLLRAANTVFISQGGAGSVNGTSCANAQTAAYFNTSGNWNASPTGIQIGPDTTVHLCGTFTGTLNSTMLTFQGSGSSGHQLIFESDSTNCADFTSPAWNGTNGAINTNGKNFLTLDGQGTGNAGTGPPNTSFSACGTIENTANGTSSANQQASRGISVPSGTNIVIQNWEIKNLYLRTGHVSEVFDETQVNAINWGSASTINTLLISNNQMHDEGWTLLGNNSDNVTLQSNEMYNAEHNFAGAPVHFTVSKNHFHDWSLWDTPSSGGFPYHHDAIHCFAGTAGATVLFVIDHNQFDGATFDGTPGDGQFNQFIFIEGNTSSTRCMAPGGQVIAVDNVGLTNGTSPGIAGIYGNATTGDVNDFWVNNIFLGNATNDSSICAPFSGTSNLTYENNACGNSGILMTEGGGSNPTFAVEDFNAWQGCTTTNCWFFGGGGPDTGSFTTWKASTFCTGSANGCDQHGIANLASTTFFALNAACTNGSVGQSCAPTAASPLKNAGANLFTTLGCASPVIPGLGSGCTDMNGNAWPSGGTWWIGAFDTSGTTSVATPTFNPVAGTYTGTQTVTISTATGGATLCYTTDNSTPTANGAGTCTHGTTYSGPVSVASSLTLMAIGSLSGDSDSAVGSAAYTINVSTVTHTISGAVKISGKVVIQ